MEPFGAGRNTSRIPSEAIDLDPPSPILLKLLISRDNYDFASSRVVNRLEVLQPQDLGNLWPGNLIGRRDFRAKHLAKAFHYSDWLEVSACFIHTKNGQNKKICVNKIEIRFQSRMRHAARGFLARVVLRPRLHASLQRAFQTSYARISCTVAKS